MVGKSRVARGSTYFTVRVYLTFVRTRRVGCARMWNSFGEEALPNFDCALVNARTSKHKFKISYLRFGQVCSDFA